VEGPRLRDDHFGKLKNPGLWRLSYR